MIFVRPFRNISSQRKNCHPFQVTYITETLAYFSEIRLENSMEVKPFVMDYLHIILDWDELGNNPNLCQELDSVFIYHTKNYLPSCVLKFMPYLSIILAIVVTILNIILKSLIIRKVIMRLNLDPLPGDSTHS